ncbi:glycerol-3-phosphate 1-O-acyltransferase PlsY [Lachnospiraceae bacterium HCP1S3_A8]|nr:glycerol-3-phosphate 1-O-acyltransferase PlsY [Lachnospiraceae bacterium]
MERILCLAVGYLFGLFQTGYIYSKLHHVDIRKEGSGNAGSTNVLRVMGVKAGATVFLGDFFKTLIPCILVRHFFQNQPEMVNLLVLYTAFGVILGHNYPFYMGFKGGKGIAATAGLLVAMDLRVTAVCLIVFILIVAVTRYVSLGSLVVVTLFLIGMVFFGSHGAYGLGNQYLMEFYLVSAAVTLMAFWRHRSNIGRLLHGTENKIGSKKK